MRAFEVVPAITDGRRVFDASNGAIDGLRLGDVATGSVNDAGAGDLAVLAATAVDTESLASLLGGVGSGVWAVVFLPTSVFDIPVGAVVEALQQSGVQAVDAIPLDDRRYGVAIVVAREDGWAPITPYLSGRKGVVPSDQAIRRVIAERVIGGLSDRTNRAADPNVAGLEARVQQLEGELKTAQKRLNGILDSRAYGLAKKIAAMKPGS